MFKKQSISDKLESICSLLVAGTVYTIPLLKIALVKKYGQLSWTGQLLKYLSILEGQGRISIRRERRPFKIYCL